VISDRGFPRYSVQTLQPTVMWNNEAHPKIEIVNVSLSGLQIKSSAKIPCKKINELDLKLKQQEYSVSVKIVWDKIKNDNFFYYGVHIKFDDITIYDQWLTFIKALHLYFQRKKT